MGFLSINTADLLMDVYNLIPIGNPVGGPSIGDIFLTPVIFTFTFTIEGVGLKYLLRRIFNVRLEIIQTLALAFVLNLATFFAGNFILFPLLLPYFGAGTPINVRNLNLLIFLSWFIPPALSAGFFVGLFTGIFIWTKRKGWTLQGYTGGSKRASER